MSLSNRREEIMCPAVAVGPLKADGRLKRCGNYIRPGEALCPVHLARCESGREVLVLDWQDGGLIDQLETFAKSEASFHHEKVVRLRRLAEEARMLEKGYVPLNTPKESRP